MSVINVGCDLGIKSVSKAIAIDQTGKIISKNLKFFYSASSLYNFFNSIDVNEDEVRIICEPTSMMWLPLAVMSKKRGFKVFRVKSEKVSDLRKYYKKHTKTDRIDAETLARIPLIDQESLYEVELPDASLQALNRFNRQYERLTHSISDRKRRIQDICMFAVPLLLNCFKDPFTLRARSIYKNYFNPQKVKNLGLKRLEKVLLNSSDKPMDSNLPKMVYEAMMESFEIYGSGEFLDFDFLSEEMKIEMKMLEYEEKLLDHLGEKIYKIYEKVHPSKNLETIPGVGKTLAPVFLATILNPNRFKSTESFRGFTGMIPRRSESGTIDGKGGKLTKAGPNNLRRALYLAADVARQWDPQIAKYYYDQMVNKGNTHIKATCAIATKIAGRILTVLKENRPYEIRDTDNRVVTREQARQIIIEKWTVPEEVRKRLRRKK